jgi:histidine triad (HIT) family protein
VSCIFCRIVAGEIPATIVARNEHALAFRDLNPQAPTHVLVIPTTHLASLADTATPAGQAALGHTMALAVEVAGQLGLKSYRVVSNVGPDAGQSVFHLHVHVLGGRKMGWPPG